MMLSLEEKRILERMQQLSEELRQTKDSRRVREIVIELEREAKRLNAREPSRPKAGV